MNFVERAQQFLDDPAPENLDPELYYPAKKTVEYLLENALGRDNSKQTGLILDYLEQHGISMNREHWQHMVLGYLRENVVFIGAWVKGMFIIFNEEDAQTAYDFYYGRIKKEIDRLKILKKQLSQAGFESVIRD